MAVEHITAHVQGQIWLWNKLQHTDRDRYGCGTHYSTHTGTDMAVEHITAHIQGQVLAVEHKTTHRQN